MAHYLLFYDFVDDIVERRAPYREEHLALVRRWREDGRIGHAGAIGEPPHGAAIAFEVDDAAQVEEFAAADPYVTEGLVTAHRIERWHVV